jgi:Bacterial TniB protein
MNESFDHLALECREEAALDPKARIRAALTERWIGYPRAALTLERLNHLLNYPPRDRMPCLLLYGATGMRKTKILRKFMRDHPTSFNSKTGVNAVPLVAIQMPPEPEGSLPSAVACIKCADPASSSDQPTSPNCT